MLRWPNPFAPEPLQPLHHYYELVRPSPVHRYFRASVFTLAPFPLASLVRFACSVQRAWTSFTPLKRRTLRNQYLGSPLRLSQERVKPLVLVPLSGYRRFLSGSLALVSLVPT